MEVHCITARGTPVFWILSTAASISPDGLIPVESMIGRPVAVMASSRSGFEISPDATFHATTPTRVNSSTASSENGELMKSSSLLRACSRKPDQCVSLNSMRFQ